MTVSILHRIFRLSVVRKVLTWIYKFFRLTANCSRRAYASKIPVIVYSYSSGTKQLRTRETTRRLIATTFFLPAPRTAKLERRARIRSKRVFRSSKIVTTLQRPRPRAAAPSCAARCSACLHRNLQSLLKRVIMSPARSSESAERSVSKHGNALLREGVHLSREGRLCFFRARVSAKRTGCKWGTPHTAPESNAL